MLFSIQLETMLNLPVFGYEAKSLVKHVNLMQFQMILHAFFLCVGDYYIRLILEKDDWLQNLVKDP